MDPQDQHIEQVREIAVYRKALRFSINQIKAYVPEEHDGACSYSDDDDRENCDCGLVWSQDDIKFLRRVLRTRGGTKK